MFVKRARTDLLSDTNALQHRAVTQQERLPLQVLTVHDGCAKRQDPFFSDTSVSQFARVPKRGSLEHFLAFNLFDHRPKQLRHYIISN